MTTETDLGAFEMLWDCTACDTPKLLGKTHRFCPNCGNPQDPKSRYFPSDEDKVAVKDHEFFGADVMCPACNVPNSSKAEFCVACGSALSGGKQAATRADQEAAEGTDFSKDSAKAARGEHKDARLAREAAMQGQAPPAPKESKPKSRTWMIVAGVAGALLIVLLVLAFWKKEATITVVGHEWRRTIGVEKFGPKTDSEWCDSVPSDAYALSRKSEVKSQKKVPDGQTCKTVRKDKGDGTFKESEKCETKYKEEPVYADKCYFSVNRWQLDRSLEAKGSGVSPEPSWPDVRGLRLGSSIGSERETNRRETYTVLLRTSDNKDSSCDYDQAAWAGLRDGVAKKAKVRMLGGGVDCASFLAAK